MKQIDIDTVHRLGKDNEDTEQYYIDYLKQRILNKNVRNMYREHEIELRIVNILMHYGVSEEDILNMSCQEGLAYIYLLL